MSKYDKLGDFLREKRSTIVHLSFAEIEAIIGAKLPASKVYAAWWSNNPWNNVMTKVWLDAGFKSARIDVDAETVDFVRAQTSTSIAAQPSAIESLAGSTDVPSASRSPLFGLLKGTTIVAPGVDLTAPADPDWAKVYDDNDVPPGAQDVIADEALNISDKIRELDQMGVSRAQIAKLLNKRYQHVRNVLVADERKAG